VKAESPYLPASVRGEGNDDSEDSNQDSSDLCWDGHHLSESGIEVEVVPKTYISVIRHILSNQAKHQHK
jgi:hypothetical protein